MKSRLEATNNVSARNERLLGINPSTIRLKFSEDGIIDPLSGKNLRDCFDFIDPVQRRISEINLNMTTELLKRDGVGVWLNPPGYSLGEYHDTGKILVAAKSKGDPVLYDITGQTFSLREFVSFMTSLSPYAYDGYYFLEDALSWEILESIIPMPGTWRGIRNDQAEARFNADVDEDMGYENSRQVYLARHGVDINDACPTGAIYKMVSPDGKIWTFAQKCGMCGKEINTWIYRGYHCKHCGEEYLGVCQKK